MRVLKAGAACLFGVCGFSLTACMPDGLSGHSAALAQTAEPVALPAKAHHLGNEGVMIEQGEMKILFDPLYRNGFNNYHLVPADVKAAIIAGTPPYDGVDAVLISHAHGDHFDAGDLIAFQTANPQTLIIAPQQAVDMMEATGALTDEMRARHMIMGMAYGADPLKLDFEGLVVEAVRVPHAGGPARREIQNLVYRVTLNAAATVMHMGDADPSLEFFVPYADHWQARRTDTAFPPYWFFLRAEGVQITDGLLNAREAIGVHVPVRLPQELVSTGRAYFAEPGAEYTIHTE